MIDIAVQGRCEQEKYACHVTLSTFRKNETNLAKMKQISQK